MGLVSRLTRVTRRTLLGRRVRVWHHPAYRLPLGGMEGGRGLEPRRADLVRWYGLQKGMLTQKHLRTPDPVGWEALSRVHTQQLLEEMVTADGLARVFGAHPSEVEVEPLLNMARTACGGTVAAAFEALNQEGPMVNLLGGFHHASPGKAGGFCPFNDLAVAIAALRDVGWTGRVNVLDLDAHPPDGTAACLADDRACWVGSISGSDWGPLPGVDETVLPKGADDATYLSALHGLLSRMPRAALTFVLAGGDVLAGDRFGQLGMTLAGAHARDRAVAHALRGQASVWVPAGGYHEDSWRVLAGTVELLITRDVRPVHRGADPLEARFAAVADQLSPTRLQGDDALLTDDDLADLFGGSMAPRTPRLLGFYTAEGVEYALFRFGLLTHIHRLGYQDLHFNIGQSATGETLKVTGMSGGQRHLLIDLVVERRPYKDGQVLFVNWLELSHPRASFSSTRPQLPGQRAPGLGMSREAGEVLGRMARRLGLLGVMVRPAHYHVAYSARSRFQFTDPARQGRFVALLRDLRGMPLLEATRAVAEGRVRLNGAPYAWEATDMLVLLDPPAHPVAPDPEIARVAAESHFTVVPAAN